MKRWILGTLLGGTLLATASYVVAQPEGMHRDMMGGRGSMMGRFSSEDMDAFADARIAALRAGLKLSADQEKLWPAVEDAIRGLVKQRRDQMQERQESRGQRSDDVPGIIRGMADRQAARAEGLRKLADATAPLYATLDEGQKRRLQVLMRRLRPHGMIGGRGYGEGMRRWRDQDR